MCHQQPVTHNTGSSDPGLTGRWRLTKKTVGVACWKVRFQLFRSTLTLQHRSTWGGTNKLSHPMQKFGLRSPLVAHYLITVKWLVTDCPPPQKVALQLYVPDWIDGDCPHRSSLLKNSPSVICAGTKAGIPLYRFVRVDCWFQSSPVPLVTIGELGRERGESASRTSCHGNAKPGSTFSLNEEEPH